MAVWQFALDLVPASAATVNGVTAARMSRDQLDATELNFAPATIDAIVEAIGTILPQKHSRVAGLRIWGDEKTDDIQIMFVGTAIEGAQFRLNVAELSLALVGKMRAFARVFDCVFATRDGAIIRPYSEALIRAITQSEAVRFVSDPARYLREAILNDPAPH